MTREQIEREALDFHAKHVGKILSVDYLCGYEGNDSTDVGFDPPILVQVQHTPRNDILHWNDEWLDPYWDVELIAGPKRAKVIRSAWIDGPSVNSKTGLTEWNNVRVLSWRQAFVARISAALRGEILGGGE